MKKLLSLFTVMVLIIGIQLSVATHAQNQPKYASSLNGWNTSYTLTGNMAEDICRVAYAQLGKNGSTLGYSYAWCAAFVSDCARLAGIPESVIKSHTQAGEGAGYFNFDKSQFISSSELKTGDLVFAHGSSDHVFICYYLNGKQLLINGNNANTVYASTLSSIPTLWKKKDGTLATIVCVRPNYRDTKNGTFISDGTYAISSACDTNKSLDVLAQSVDDKANVHLWSNGSQNSQKWKITKNGSYYTIINVNSGKALDVENGSTTSGANVWQYKPNGTNAQKWYFEDAGNGYVYIRSACGLYLDLYGSNTGNGTNILVFKNNGGHNNQKWKLVSYSNSVATDNTTSSSESWGEWSEWTTTPVYGNDNRQVETGTAYVYYHYILGDDVGCGAYPVNRATMVANGLYYSSEEYHEYTSLNELTKNTNGRLVYLVNGERKIYDKYFNTHCNGSFNFAPGYANNLYFKGTTTKYRYRDKIVQTHIHCLSELKYDIFHPHKEYNECTTCGEKIYTGNTSSNQNCLICFSPTVKKALTKFGRIFN